MLLDDLLPLLLLLLLVVLQQLLLLLLSLLPQVTACLREGGSLRHHNSHTRDGASDITGDNSDITASSCGSQRLGLL